MLFPAKVRERLFRETSRGISKYRCLRGYSSQEKKIFFNYITWHVLSRIIVEWFQNMYKVFPGSQWLGLYTLTAKGPSSILGWRIMIPQAKWHSQEKKIIYIYNFIYIYINAYVHLYSSVAQPFPTLCDPMDCSMAGLPVHHQLPEFTQTLVHRVGDAIQPSHPLSSPSPPAFNLSQHQGLF